MKCEKCHSEMQTSQTTVTVPAKKIGTLTATHVPAYLCSKCDIIVADPLCYKIVEKIAKHAKEDKINYQEIKKIGFGFR